VLSLKSTVLPEAVMTRIYKMDTGLDCLRAVAFPGSINGIGALDVFVYRNETERHVAKDFEGEDRAHGFQSGLAESSYIEVAIQSR